MQADPSSSRRAGDQRLDLTYARDVAQSVVKGCLVDSFEGHVFHIGSGRTYTLNDFADAIRTVIPGAQVEVGPGLDPRGMGPLAYYALDISRARRELGYEPQVSTGGGDTRLDRMDGTSGTDGGLGA